MEKAYFAGGCFWCITPMFHRMDGVKEVISGYSGGEEEAPTYEEVKHQQTLHRETVMVEYDPSRVTYEELLDVFLMSVDPFDAQGQFGDVGRSYTLAVYYRNEAEKDAAEAAVGAIREEGRGEPCIAVEAFRSFWPAEEYHQYWYLKNPEAFREEMRHSGREKA